VSTDAITDDTIADVTDATTDNAIPDVPDAITHDAIADVANAVEAASIFRIPDPPPRTIRIRCMAAAGVRQP
jgi:hypothetical protein